MSEVNAVQQYLDSVSLSWLENDLLEVMVYPQPEVVAFAKKNLWPNYLASCDALGVPIRADFVKFWQPDYRLSVGQRRVRIMAKMSELNKELGELVKECGSSGHRYEVTGRYRGHDGYGDTDDYWESVRCAECGHSEERRQSSRSLL